MATNAEIRLKDGGFAGRLVDLFKASHSCCPPVLVGAPIQKGILQPQVGQVSMSHLLSQGPHSSSPRLAGTGVLEKNVYHYPSAFSTQLGLPWSRMQKRSHEETGKLCWNSFPQLVHGVLCVIRSKSFGARMPRTGATGRCWSLGFQCSCTYTPTDGKRWQVRQQLSIGLGGFTCSECLSLNPQAPKVSRLKKKK